MILQKTINAVSKEQETQCNSNLSGDILVFVEDRQPPAPLTVYRSRDDGKTWEPEKAV